MPDTLAFSEKEQTLFAKLFYLWLSPPKGDILTIMDKIGQKAKEKGMTEEILNQILDEE